MDGAVLVLVFAVLAGLTAWRGVKTVGQGRNFTVERFGRYTRTLQPGLHLIVPFIDRIGARIDMRETVLDVPSQEIITKDNAMVRVDGIVFFQVLDAARASYEVNDLRLAILNLTMTNLRTVMGALDLDECLGQRDSINDRVLGVVDAATSPWGVKVTRIEIANIEPPRDLVDSMARQMKAERDRRAAILEAEGVRQAEILKAEGQKQSAILEAEGRKEAAFRDAEARERAAEAEAKATAMVSTAIAQGDARAVSYFLGLKYVEALGEFAQSKQQKTVFLPLDATNVMGALGGIAELVRGAGAEGATAPPAGPWGGRPPAA